MLAYARNTRRRRLKLVFGRVDECKRQPLDIDSDRVVFIGKELACWLVDCILKILIMKFLNVGEQIVYITTLKAAMRRQRR